MKYKTTIVIRVFVDARDDDEAFFKAEKAADILADSAVQYWGDEVLDFANLEEIELDAVIHS